MVRFMFRKNKSGAYDIIRKKITVSTNNDARDMIKNSPSDTLIIADEQSGGRGRQGKTFLSPDGGLYMTLLLRCGMPIRDVIGATSCAAVAVIRALKNTVGLEAEIKWVNDIYICGRKLCGILTEAVNDYGSGTTEYLIIGIGMNLSSSPTLDIRSGTSAISLAELGIDADRDRLAYAIADELIKLRGGGFCFTFVKDEYISRSAVLGREITFIKNGESRRGTAVRIENGGELVVKTPDGETILDSGEISVRLN